MEKTAKKKRLHVLLDEVNFSKLESIKRTHGDATFTQALKRAIQLQHYFDEQTAEGFDFFVSEDSGESFHKLVKNN